MNPEDEARLLLYVYGELAADEREALESRLAADPALRHQLAVLEADLANIDGVFQAPEPEPGFEDRLWQRLAARMERAASAEAADDELAAARARRSTPAMLSRGSRPVLKRLATGMAWAASVLLALGLGLWLGRTPPATDTMAPPMAQTGQVDGRRILAGELVGHLKATEQVLLLATHEPDQGALAARLASELIESHRVYAAAAERAGRPQLAAALRQLEPALLELATAPEHTVDALLRAAIEAEDLPFKARSAAWAVENQMQQTGAPGAPRG